MKHLKQFESTYNQINGGDSHPKISTRDNFTENEVNALRYICANKYRVQIFTHAKYRIELLFTNKKESSCSIIKSKDEWFLVAIVQKGSHPFLYFICDQIDGVIDCIKENLFTLSESYTKIKSLQDPTSIDVPKFSEERIIPVQQKIIDFLKRKFPHFEFQEPIPGIQLGLFIQISRSYVVPKNYKIGIWEYEDEWFYVSSSYGGTYECDQLQGLVEFIENCVKTSDESISENYTEDINLNFEEINSEYMVNNYPFENKIPFDKRMINIIKSIDGFKMISDGSTTDTIENVVILNPFYPSRKYSGLKEVIKSAKVYIKRYEDDWFIVQFALNTSFPAYSYKCDQIEGVLTCLNHINKWIHYKYVTGVIK